MTRGLEERESLRKEKDESARKLYEHKQETQK